MSGMGNEDFEPHLAAATTRELLEELRARGEVGRDGPFKTWLLAEVALSLLGHYPPALLDYRTVDA